MRMKLTREVEDAAPYVEDGNSEECASMIHRLIEIGNKYKLEMGRVLLNMMADRGSICIHSLKRKIITGVKLNDREVMIKLQRQVTRSRKPSFVS